MFQRLCQSRVGYSLHSVMKSSSQRFESSLIVYAFASTVSPKGGVAILVFRLRGRGGCGLVADFIRGNGKFSFFLPGIICRVGSVPTIFSFVLFSRTCCTWVLVLQLGLSQRCPFLLRNSVLFVVGDTVLCSGHIYHSGNNNLSVVAPSCLPSLLRLLC